MIWCSIDPGKNGAIVYWDKSTPVKVKRLADVDFMEVPIPRMFQNIQFAICERVHGIIGDAASSSFTFGYVVGRLHQSILSDCQHLALISPMEWMNIMHAGMLKGVKTKVRSKIVASNLYSDFITMVDATKAGDDGIHDALLIGHYYWHYLRGKL